MARTVTKRVEEEAEVEEGGSREEREAGVVSRVRYMRRLQNRTMDTLTEDVGATSGFRWAGKAEKAARKGPGLAAAMLGATVFAATAPHLCTIGLTGESLSRTHEYGTRRPDSNI